jgi:hypothetical protein
VVDSDVNFCVISIMHTILQINLTLELEIIVNKVVSYMFCCIQDLPTKWLSLSRCFNIILEPWLRPMTEVITLSISTTFGISDIYNHKTIIKIKSNRNIYDNSKHWQRILCINLYMMILLSICCHFMSSEAKMKQKSCMHRPSYCMRFT